MKSAYELKREANIIRNEKRLAELGLHTFNIHRNPMNSSSRVESTPAAGGFDADAACNFRCSVHKGHIREGPRGGSTTEFQSIISEGLGVVLAKVLSFVSRTMSSEKLISQDLFFKKSKGAPQSQYVKLTEDNFKDMMKTRWDLVTNRDVVFWSDNGKSVLEGFF